MTTERTLAQRLLQKIAEISRRSDVVVRQQAGPFTRLSSRWEKVLPSDMYAFFAELNGQSFHFSFEGDDAWHGFSLQTLGEDGATTVVPATGRAGLSRLPARQLPQYFLQPGQVADDQAVLLFCGSDDAAGILLVGEGAQATLRTWNNDGLTELVPGSFSELMERLIDAGFAHTWASKDHPQTAAVKARLATAVPARKSFELHVDELVEVAERDFVRQRCEEWKKPMLAKVAAALGIKGAAKLDGPAVVDQVVGALTGAEPLTAKMAKAVMAAAGARKRGQPGAASRLVRPGRRLADARHADPDLPAAGDPPAAGDDHPHSRAARDRRAPLRRGLHGGSGGAPQHVPGEARHAVVAVPGL